MSSVSFVSAAVISSAVMDVGQRLSMVCTKQSPSLRMVPPTTVSGPKYSSAVAMPTPAPVVSLVRLRTSSKNERSCWLHRLFSSR